MTVDYENILFVKGSMQGVPAFPASVFQDHQITPKSSRAVWCGTARFAKARVRLPSEFASEGYCLKLYENYKYYFTYVVQVVSRGRFLKETS